MDTLPSKLAELSVLVNNINNEIPQLRDHISTIHVALATLQLNTQNLEKQIEDFEEQGKDVTTQKIELEHIISSQKKMNEEISKLKEMYYDIIQNSEPHEKSEWNLKSVIQIAPSVITILTFLGWIVYTLFIAKTNGIF